MNCATGLKATLVFSLVVVATSGVLAQAPVAVNPAIDAMERQLEIGRHERLLTRTAENDAALNAFTTDGCSGGLSIGWEQLAGRFPEFSARHGDEPPIAVREPRQKIFRDGMNLPPIDEPLAEMCTDDTNTPTRLEILLLLVIDEQIELFDVVGICGKEERLHIGLSGVVIGQRSADPEQVV